LTTETEYGGTVTNVKGKRVPGGESSCSKTTTTKACVCYKLVADLLPEVANLMLRTCNGETGVMDFGFEPVSTFNWPVLLLPLWWWWWFYGRVDPDTDAW